MSDRRLHALLRKFKAVWKERDRRGLVIEMPHAARTEGVMVTKALFERLTDAFESRWLAGQSTFEIWFGVVRDSKQTLTFSAVSPGVAQLSCKLVQPWKRNETPVRTFNIQIEIAGR
jgi:hypothetical protein